MDTTKVANTNATEPASAAKPNRLGAVATWADERSYVTTSEPTAKQLSKHVMWGAGLWVASGGEQLLYLTGRC